MRRSSNSLGISSLLFLFTLTGGPQVSAEELTSTKPNWQQLLDERLPEFGHRNWIVIADSAYPAQTQPGIETIVTNSDQIEVVAAVLTALGRTKHVRPLLYTDTELKFVPEADAAGINVYREHLSQVLADRTVSTIPHEELIAKLDKAGKTFQVLILKPNLSLPYTSVFIELDCGYWSAEAESRLRAELPARKP